MGQGFLLWDGKWIGPLSMRALRKAVLTRAPLCCGITCFCLPSCLGLLAQVAGVSSNCRGLPGLYGETVRALAACQEQSCRKYCSCCPAQTEATSH